MALLDICHIKLSQNRVTPSSEIKELYWCNSQFKIYDSHIRVKIFNKPIFWAGPPRPKKEFESKQKRAHLECEQRVDSVARSREKAYDIVWANEWDQFVTFTLDPKQIDRESPEQVANKLKNWLRNKAYRDGWLYLIIPEYHLDGKGIHFHGVIKGQMKRTDSGRKDAKGHTIYNSDQWTLGWSTVIDIYGDKRALAAYMMKYITKNKKGRVLKHYFYAGGKGLKRTVPAFYDLKDFDKAEGRHVVVDKPEVHLEVKYNEFDLEK